MKDFGGTMFFFGLGSAVLNLVGMEFVILSWIDSWGPAIGWTIRAALALGGAALWFAGRRSGTAVD